MPIGQDKDRGGLSSRTRALERCIESRRVTGCGAWFREVRVALQTTTSREGRLAAYRTRRELLDVLVLLDVRALRCWFGDCVVTSASLRSYDFDKVREDEYRRPNMSSSARRASLFDGDGGEESVFKCGDITWDANKINGQTSGGRASWRGGGRSRVVASSPQKLRGRCVGRGAPARPGRRG